jgi:hypothetical protein
MKITKELKYATFEWEEETKTFSVTDANNNNIELNKIYGFALMRFIIRIAQRNFLKNPLPKAIVSDILEEEEDVHQDKFSF